MTMAAQGTPTIQQAMQLHGQGRLDDAQRIYQLYLDAQPDNGDLNYLMGSVLLQKQQNDDALGYFERCNELDATNANYSNTLANLLVGKGEIDRALNILSKSFKANPQNMKLLATFATIAEQHDRYAKVETLLRSMSDKIAHTVEYVHLMAYSCFDQGKYAQAIRFYDELVTKHKRIMQEVIVGYARSVILTRSKEFFDQYIAFANTIPATDPIYKELMQQLQVMYAAIGDYDKARDCIIQAIEKTKPTLDLIFDRSLMELTRSNLTEGFADFRIGQMNPKCMEPNIFVPAPRWRGEDIKGKRLFIGLEQGVGDLIMWAGLLPYLQQQKVDITLTTYPKMKALMERSFPDIRILEWEKTLPDELMETGFDYHCLMGDLMEYCLQQHEPSQHAPVLKVDDVKAQALRTKYLNENGAKKLIGISWATQRNGNHYLRNIDLKTWLPLLKANPDAQFVSLQYDKRLEDVEAINEQLDRPIIHDDTIDSFEDIDAWATQIEAMDEVITIQNATAHLGGAIGKPTTLLLSSYSCWRWGTQESNRWYKSVDIMRQTPFEEWSSVFKRLLKKREAAS
ncbi:MAG: tetratricopeptide repeat protein [Rickettsiales bacterium]|nr:tetratricopeptide repeat protein [Rickettsiales bacterium]